MSENIFKSAVYYHSKKEFKKAKEIYEGLLKVNPNNLAIMQNYAALLSQTGEYKKADKVFEKCLEIKPKDALILYNYGKFFQDQKKFDEAIRFYKNSFKINPKKNLSQYNIGNIYLYKGQYKEAIDYFKKSLLVSPENYLAYNNIGIAYKKLGNFDQAIKFYEEALNKNKNYADGHVNYSTMLLTLNKLELGFKEYEWRKKSKVFSDYLNYRDLKIKSPIWLGEKISGKTILIFAEQGIGDLIQFSRYLYALRDKYNCKVIFRLKQNLSHFFKDDGIKIITEKEKIPEHDFHNHIASLPGIFFKEFKNFPKTVNFINENEKIFKKWTNILDKYKGLKIGINSHSTATVGERIIPLNNFIHLTNLKKINFFIIQKDFNKTKISNINQNSNVNYFEDMDKNVKPFEDTIGIIKNLDLIITADTSLAHLAATLGKKTWIVLPFVSDWRWFNQDQKSIWYNNVTLYKQKKIGDWDQVFKIISKDLKKNYN